ncbi:hypothetical protein FisN_5Hh299 [Fistulifera solaris]|uniref:Uncharacterized protein n=1 Tax=Fistulifera solaris TaxID=1519565 RepID=A0A1Z5JSU1_FISSO|nr:hypothetical protein FisN_5Hh299 [Fistulifera solaris]|eukprot:GAX16922.1 hypothetical protein FisN_5Hh299 [Fistulifera solaris]
MLRLWNRSPNTASAKKSSEGAKSNNSKPKETSTNHGNEKENDVAKQLESPQRSSKSQSNAQSKDLEFLLECKESAPSLAHESIMASQNPPRTTKTSVATQTIEDPYEWAYEIWREMGLMGSRKKVIPQTTLLVESHLISDIIGGIEDRVHQQQQEKQEELRKQQEMQQKKKENEWREQNMVALITPRSSTFPSTFNERARRRMSLPSQLIQKKQEGRKSFAHILQHWREKSDDKPNAHFLSPGKLSPLRSSRSTSKEEQIAPVGDSFQRGRVHEATAVRTSDSKSKPDDDSACVSQASKIREQYFQSRRDTRASSRGRTRTQVPEAGQDGPGRNIRRTRSASRSRGDFRTAVQQVLENVDAVHPLPRSKSALFANTPTHRDHPDYQREDSTDCLHSEFDFVPSPLDHRGKSGNGARYQRSKSAPRSIDRNTLHNMSDADRKSSGLVFPSPERDVKPNQGSKRRMTDFMDLTRETKTFNTDDNCSIPSHVEIDDDEHYSVADSKLTDIRTECESLGPSPIKTPADSPWTRNIHPKVHNTQPAIGSASRDGRPWHRDIIINRVGSIGDSRFPADGECFCSSGLFAGKDDLIDFFLPLMGTGCTCGKYSTGLRNPEEPTSLENILRPWQVDFLAGFGIYRGDEMVKAHHRSGNALATALRQYQKKKGISSFRTKSCAMALEIWAKTCKAFVRSIRKQLTEGTVELKLPNTLYILSSFLEKLPVHGNDLNMSSSSSVASGAWSVTHSRTPLAKSPYEAIGMKYVTRTESSDVSEV